MYCPTCGEPTRENANFCGRCGLNLEPVRTALAGSENGRAAGFEACAAPVADLPTLGLSLEGLMAVEALWADVSCTNPGRVNVSRRDIEGGREYMQLFLRGSCLSITCSKSKTHVARDLIKGKKVGEVFDRRRFAGPLLFETLDGPTCLGYADTQAHPGREPRAQLLTASDGEEFERFQASLNSNFGLKWGQTVAAVSEGGRIVSAAGYKTGENRIARVIVATAPEFRRRRLASECVSRVAQEAFRANLLMEYQAGKEDAAATAFARRLGFVPFAERILITFKDDSPSTSLRAAELQLSTPTQTINEVLSGQSNWEAIKEKYGEPAVVDARAVADVALSLPWYGSSYEENRSRFESECRSMFPWISEEALDSLHMVYAGGWIP
jgi:GNAT superfamily N-acetyltransferase